MPPSVDDAALERLRTDGFAILPGHFDAETTARARRCVNVSFLWVWVVWWVGAAIDGRGRGRQGCSPAC